MLSKLKSTLKTNFIRPILLFFGMLSAKLPFIKDPTPFSVVMYYDWFCSNRLDLGIYRVVQVNYYKEMDSAAQHEKIIAKVTTAEPNVFGYLLFERTPGSAIPQTLAEFFTQDTTDPGIQMVQLTLKQDGLSSSLIDQAVEHKADSDFTATSAPTPKRSSISPTSSITSVSSSADSLKTISNASDTVTQVDGFPTNSTSKKNRIQLVKTLHPHNLLLSDLVTLAYTIHSKNPLYIIFEAQCYWFANMIMCLLEREYANLVTDVAATEELEHVDKVCEWMGGKWHSIRVHTAKQSILDSIAMQFKENLDVFKARVQAMKDAEEQTEKDRIAREAAEEQAEGERRTRKEAEEKAQEAEERAKEAEERARQALEEVASLRKQLASNSLRPTIVVES